MSNVVFLSFSLVNSVKTWFRQLGLICAKLPKATSQSKFGTSADSLDSVVCGSATVEEWTPSCKRCFLQLASFFLFSIASLQLSLKQAIEPPSLALALLLFFPASALFELSNRCSSLLCKITPDAILSVQAECACVHVAASKQSVNNVLLCVKRTILVRYSIFCFLFF